MTDGLIRVVVQGDEAEAGLGRINTAMARLERSEPTMALRSTRRAIDELAVAASGLNPALGRMVSTFAQFGIGGEIGLGAVAGFAAIGLEIKSLIAFSGELDKTLVKLDATFAHLGGAGAAGFAQLAQLQSAEPSQPGPLMRLFARIGTFFEPVGQEGDLQTAIETGISAQDAATSNAIRLEMMQIRRTHAEQLRQGLLEREKREEQATLLRRLGRLDLIGPGPLPGTLDLGPLPGHVDPGALIPIRFGGRVVNPRFLPSAEQITEAPDEVSHTNAAAVVAASLSVLGAMKVGGAGGVLSGIGGLAGSLAGIPGAGILGPVGLGLTAFGGLTSLFGGGGQKPQVIISAFEGQALEEIKRLRADPLTTQFTVIAGPGDPRQLTQQLGRLARKGVIQRLP